MTRTAKQPAAFTYPHPRPSVAVDIVLFTVTGSLNDLRLKVLLIQRMEEPWRERWALPGGFVRLEEDLEAAALREMTEETGVAEALLEQVGAVGTPGRDPRGHVVTVVYVGLTAGDRHHLLSRGDAANASWFEVGPKTLPPLAFDHAELLEMALAHLRRRLAEVPICFELLPETFTMSELRTLTEAILGKALDRRNFQRKVVQELGLVRPVEGTRRQGGHRPAQLFRFVPERFREQARKEKRLPF